MVARQSIAYPVTIAFSGTAWPMFCASLSMTLLRNWPHSPAEVVSVADKVFWLAISTSVLLNAIGSRQGWANGPLSDVLIGFGGLFIFYVLVGKRLLRIFLEARSASPTQE